MFSKPKSQWTQIPNQSDFHEEVRLIFITDPYFSHVTCYQEVYVKTLIEDYEDYNHRYDWHIPSLNMIIELHGQQHYVPTRFGNGSNAIDSFRKTKISDNQKKISAIDAGFIYITINIKHKNKLAAILNEAATKGISHDYE